MVVLRPYQQHAVEAALAALASGTNPLISLPTGAGKSLVLASLCTQVHERGQRSLVATHRKELLEQDAAALAALAPDLSQGIYSAGLERRDTTQNVIFGGIQSIYHKMAALQQRGRFACVIVDESHLVSKKAASMYGQVFAELPGVPRVGLTATPYRLDSGLLYQGEGALFNHLAIHVKPSALVPEYLAPLVGIGTDTEMSVAGVHSARGDYVTKELEQQALDQDLIQATVSEAKRLAADRSHWLVFCVTVAHTEAVCAELNRQGVEAALVTGETPSEQRAATIAAFKAGALRALVNCMVLTTGFDAPLTDCLVMLRPTQSKGLWVQCLGRGMRNAPGKDSCVVLDFAGNIARHGSIDCFQQMIPSPRQEAERKKKAEQEERALEAMRKLHAARAATGDPMKGGGGDNPDGLREVRVADVRYKLLPSKTQPGKTNIMALYRCRAADNGPPISMVTQFVCLEYSGAARGYARQWFTRRGVLAAPATAAGSQPLFPRLPVPSSLSVKPSGAYWNVAIEHWNDAPEPEEEYA